MASGNEAALCQMASNFYQGAKEGESPRRVLHKCTMKCMLLQKGAVNYCGCISRIEGAYIRIVGASAPTKRYKITPLGFGTLFGQETRQKQILCPSKFERGSQLGISEDRNRQKPLLAKKSVSKRTHPCACTWTAVRKQECGHSHGWLLISPFLNIGCLEIPV